MSATHAGPDMPTISHPNADLMTTGTPSYAAARMQAEEPPPPKHSAHYGPGPEFFVVGCLNCRFCGDGGHPEMPTMWRCAHPSVIGTPSWCQWARETPSACGWGAKWYKDAITGR